VLSQCNNCYGHCRLPFHKEDNPVCALCGCRLRSLKAHHAGVLARPKQQEMR
jgi:hypothetical protein